MDCKLSGLLDPLERGSVLTLIDKTLCSIVFAQSYFDLVFVSKILPVVASSVSSVMMDPSSSSFLLLLCDKEFSKMEDRCDHIACYCDVDCMNGYGDDIDDAMVAVHDDDMAKDASGAYDVIATKLA